MCGFGRICMTFVDCAANAGAFKDGRIVASNNAAWELMLFQRKAKRSADQTYADNRDLANAHER